MSSTDSKNRKAKGSEEKSYTNLMNNKKDSNNLVNKNNDDSYNLLTKLKPSVEEITSDLMQEYASNNENMNQGKKRIAGEVKNQIASEDVFNNEISETELNKRKKFNKCNEISTQTQEAQQDIERRSKLNVETLNELFDRTKHITDNNVNKILLALDKVIYDYNSKTVEHNDENGSYKQNFYSLSKFNRYKTLCTHNQGLAKPKSYTENQELGTQALNKVSSWNNLKSFRKKNESLQKGVNKLEHPAPFPVSTYKLNTPEEKDIPPTPSLLVEIEKLEIGTAVILTWEIPGYDGTVHEKVKGYELYGYRENDVEIITHDAWKQIGTIPSYTPPVKCTLTDFTDNSTYHFAVRIRDVLDRLSGFSQPCTIKI